MIEMKKKSFLQFRYLLYLSAISLCCYSCGDDFSPEEDSTLLPEGEYPVTFVSRTSDFTVSDPSFDGSFVWSAGDEIAVQIDSEVKKYTVSSDGNALSASDPFYWKSSNETKRVSAWFPYSETQPVNIQVESDQKSEDNFRKSDFLATGVGVRVAFGGDNMLSFSHRVAKVTIKLNPSEQIQNIDGAEILLVDLEGVNGGTVVSPYVTDETEKVYTAYLSPQDVSGKEFVQVDLNGKTYYYLPDEGDGLLVSGKYYVYNVSVTKEGLVGKLEQSGAWEGTDQEVSTELN